MRRMFGGAAMLLVILVVAVATNPSDAADWPQWRGSNRDGVWTETGLVERFESAQLPLKWRAALGSGYCGPTVAEGRVFVMDRMVKPTRQERVQCFDAETGTPLWSYAYDCVYERVQYEAGPRASVTINAGRAYSLGTMGHLHCFDAKSGKVLWSHDCRKEYAANVPVWGIAGSPLVEGDLVIVAIGGKDNACLMAFDKATGQEKWRALKDGGLLFGPDRDRAGEAASACLPSRTSVSSAWSLGPGSSTGSSPSCRRKWRSRSPRRSSTAATSSPRASTMARSC